MIYLALAAFNESKNLPGLFNAVEAMAQRSGLAVAIVIVNDGSSDNTTDVIMSFQQRLNIELIQQKNQGFLKALSRALRQVVNIAKDDDICITMDADNTHPAVQIPVLVDAIRKGKDLVIASRFQSGGGMRGVSWHRRVMSFGAKWVMTSFIGIPQVKDYSTAFRAYRLSLLKEAFKKYPESLLEGKGFSGMAGFLIRLSTLTKIISEVPLVLRYDVKKGVSRMNLVQTIRGYIEIIIDHKRGKFLPR